MPIARAWLVLLTASMFACSGVQIPRFAMPSQTLRDRAYVLHAHFDPDELFDAAQRVAAAESNEVLVDAERREVISYVRIAPDMRERREVRARPLGGLAIRVRTELRDVHGAWQRSDEMCATYRFARERVLAADVVSAIGHPDAAPRVIAYCAHCGRR